MPLAGVSPSTRLKRSRTRFADLLDAVAKLLRSPSFSGNAVRRDGAHIPGRADAPLEQPGLVVEAVRIDEAVRPAQAHREPPALARDAPAELGPRPLLVETALRYHDSRILDGSGALGLDRRFRLELEAQAALARAPAGSRRRRRPEVPAFQLRARAGRRASGAPWPAPSAKPSANATSAKKTLLKEKKPREARKQPKPAPAGQLGLQLQA